MQNECSWIPSEQVPLFDGSVNSQVDISDLQLAEFSYAYMCTNWCPCLNEEGEKVLTQRTNRVESIISMKIDRAAIN